MKNYPLKIVSSIDYLLNFFKAKIEVETIAINKISPKIPKLLKAHTHISENNFVKPTKKSVISLNK